MRKALEQLIGKKNLVGAEIGVSSGVHALEILTGLDIKKLYLVDPYAVYEQEGGTLNPTGEEPIARKRLKDYKQVVFIKKLSVEAAKQIKNESLDFVYIDANHQYEFVKADIIAWIPKVKIDGIIGGHDFGREGVNKAVKELFPESKFPEVEKRSSDDWWAVRTN